MSNTSGAVYSDTTWQNWSRNLYYPLAANQQSYFIPKNLQDLRSRVLQAASTGKKVRVSGQRHAQPPLVANAPQADPNLILIDMSCYADLGDGTQRMVLNDDQLTVNTGVREDELDTFLTQNNKILPTVTAGGFFSIGGMTAVDVHGATTGYPIFAETATAYTIMGPDGNKTTFTQTSPAPAGFNALQFARVSFGALGVVTSVTLQVLPRPFANTLSGGIEEGKWQIEADFVQGFGALLASKTRVESFFNPYDSISPFLCCWWNVNNGSGPGNSPAPVDNACQLAGNQQYGAPYIGELAVDAGVAAQETSSSVPASLTSEAAIAVIYTKVTTANANASDLWLDDAARTIFMSYFIELPDLREKGLDIVWRALQAVRRRVVADNNFHVAAPLEFRFVRGGNTLLAGTYSERPNSVFVNLDLIGFALENEDKTGLVYSDKLLQFFADVERDWVVTLGGMPHGGKMYGFYDPNGPARNFSLPFNPKFVDFIRNKRASRVAAFNAFRQQRDPKGMFCNPFVAQMIGA